MAEKYKSCQKNIGARNLKIECNDCDSLHAGSGVFQSEEGYCRCDGCTQKKNKRVD